MPSNTARKNLSEEQVIDALREAEGSTTRAAELLGINRHTLHNYWLKEKPAVKEAYRQFREQRIDQLEEKCFRIAEGLHGARTKEQNMALRTEMDMARFLLAKLRAKLYGDSVRVGGLDADGNPTAMKWTVEVIAPNKAAT